MVVSDSLLQFFESWHQMEVSGQLHAQAASSRYPSIMRWGVCLRICQSPIIIIIIIIIIITYLLTYLLIYSLTHSFTHSLTHSMEQIPS
jgi:hypothetical protein